MFQTAQIITINCSLIKKTQKIKKIQIKKIVLYFALNGETDVEYDFIIYLFVWCD